MNLREVGSVYLLGIGGIGMSALARYFLLQGARVSGYDKTPTSLTTELIREGMHVHFTEDLSALPEKIDLVVVTPAIPKNHQEWSYLKSTGIPILKRSEVLGIIAREYRTIAVAGTHGKTTTSTLIAHILRSAGVLHVGFLGGISKNYGTNFLHSVNPLSRDTFCVAEADEFDHSFLHLSPDIAVITSADADHLDVYHDLESLRNSFTAFTARIRNGGCLIMKEGTGIRPDNPNVTRTTYSLDGNTDYAAADLRISGGKVHFSLRTPNGLEEGYVSGIPGRFNIENAVAAAAAAHAAGLSPDQIREGIRTYQGVSRRFDFRIERKDLIYIDDYAHHPEELKACINAVKELFPGKQVTGVFQPHLYSRTRDFAREFGEALSLLDTLILLPIYPARELPIEGISSGLIYDQAHPGKKILSSKEDLIRNLKGCKPEVILTMGAGDIDQLSTPIIKAFEQAG